MVRNFVKFLRVPSGNKRSRVQKYARFLKDTVNKNPGLKTRWDGCDLLKNRGTADNLLDIKT